MSLTGMLLVIFAVAIGVATFIENDFGTPAAWKAVYDALWFEALIGLMVVNMIGVIFTHKLYQVGKLPSLLFHVAFIIILIGAAITRYTGVTGMMHIREGEASNTFLSDETYIIATVSDGQDVQSYYIKSSFDSYGDNSFEKRLRYQDKEISLQLTDFVPNASFAVAEAEDGIPIISLVTTDPEGGRDNRFIQLGDTKLVNNFVVNFSDSLIADALQFVQTDTGLVFRAPFEFTAMTMATQETAMYEANVFHKAPFRSLMNIAGQNFVISDYDPRAKLELVAMPKEKQSDPSIDALKITVGSDIGQEDIIVYGGKGYSIDPHQMRLGPLSISVGYGSKTLVLPFGLRLRDFQLDRYPGSESPAAYASEVTVEDPEGAYDYRIFMNNILEHKGYRFYQSSYDMDELGTVLSVNQDKLGTAVTYFGYVLLGIGLIAVLFARQSRFKQLSRFIDKIHDKRKTMATSMMLLLATTVTMAGPEPPSQADAEAFGKVLYQTNDGRIIPINTLANDVLRKVYKKASFEGMTPEQVLLGMLSNPAEWQKTPMIVVKHQEVKDLIGISGKYANFTHFFKGAGEYVIRDAVNEAYQKRPADRTKADKEFIAVDERVNICFMIYQGGLLRIFPVPEDKDYHWITPVDPGLHGMTGMDSAFVRNAVFEYFRSLGNENLGEGHPGAEYILNGIKLYQTKYGQDIIPSEGRIDLEITYNRLNVFKRLFPYYMLVGFGFLILLFVKIFNPKANIRTPIHIGLVLMWLGFLAHTGGLILRWYLSGHAPWSNGYESMIYIAWAGMLAGFIFSKKSEMTLAVTAILAGVILFVAHLSWMDPEITNLQPVLNSYWLTIHVSCITASYGFFGLGALLAFLNLITMIMKNQGNKLRLDLTIKELTYVIEMTLTIGLVLLTIGNFLGGVWANESWGRYWAWDPKETWALASIIFYAFVLHMRFIPGMRSTYTFNLASLLAFGSIIMTYFGVNYYLSGLHSYAAGDPVPVPVWVYYTVAIIAVVAIAAWWKNKHNKSAADQVEEEFAEN